MKFEILDVSINGLSQTIRNGSLYSMVMSPGACTMNQISVVDEKLLQEHGQEEIGKVEIAFSAHEYDINEYDEIIEEETFANESVTLYPNGKTNVSNFTRESQSTDEILIDNEYVTVLVTGYQDNREKYEYIGKRVPGDSVNLFITNKTDETLALRVETSSCNELMQYSGGTFYIAAKSSLFQDVYLYGDDLENAEITKVGKIDFLLRVYSSDGGEIGKDLVTEIVTVYPNGIDAVDTYTREAQDTDEIIVDTERITATVTGYTSLGGNEALNMFFENKSDENIIVNLEEISINGIELELQGYLENYAKKYIFAGMDGEISVYLTSILEEKGITAMEKIAFKVRVTSFDYTNGQKGEEWVSELITVEP